MPQQNQTATLRARWQRLSLAGQFGVAGSVILLLGMACIGLWVTQRIEDGVTRNTAAATALYMESFVAPLITELADSDQLSQQAREQLDSVLKNNQLAQRVLSFKIWKEDGLIAYSSRHEIIGKRFPTTPNLRAAWAGEVTAEFDTLVDEEDAAERVRGIPLLEMYAPMREPHTGRIFAVAEFYERAETLQQNLFNAHLQSWLVVALLTAAMLGALAGIVLRGSRTIDRQRLALEQRVGELSRLLTQNEQLRDRLQRASRRTTEINEGYLRRISADLHDGPAQLLSLALLRLDALQAQLPNAADDDMQVVRCALTDAIGEVREICNGLTLPELERLSPAKLLHNAAASHERRSGRPVAVDIASAPETLPKSIKICLFRFVQETLNNALRHAEGRDQRLRCQVEDGLLSVSVSDAGPGFDPERPATGDGGLGLPGLRERIESLGGELQIDSAPGRGSCLTLRCRIEKEDD